MAENWGEWIGEKAGATNEAAIAAASRTVLARRLAVLNQEQPFWAAAGEWTAISGSVLVFLYGSWVLGALGLYTTYVFSRAKHRVGSHAI